MKVVSHSLKLKSFNLELMFMSVSLFSSYCVAFDLRTLCDCEVIGFVNVSKRMLHCFRLVDLKFYTIPCLSFLNLCQALQEK